MDKHMYYAIDGRELPPMRDWPQFLLNEAVDQHVEFGMLILGQGKVTVRLLHANHGLGVATVQVVHDPRQRVNGLVFPMALKFFHEVRSHSQDFSLVRPSRDELYKKRLRMTAQRLIRQARAADQPAKPAMRREIRADR